MSGISHVLSIAKEALLTHQLSIQVASHNVANVDTPGYTRQSLQLETNNATPISAGLLGGGVVGTNILRNYDQFMTQRLAKQESTLGNLQAQQDSMKLVETVFNEAPGMAINDLMNKFWSSWQDLSNNPEISATRQAVTQSSQLIIDQLHSMTSEMTQAKFDIGVSLDTAIGDVNSIVSQIANLNVQISGAESAAAGQANDLRDKRDSLINDLSKLLSVTSFENKTGSTTVLMADGHTLVESNESWQVDWENNELIWVNKDAKGTETRRAIGGGAELGGKIGGWLEVRSNLTEGDPNNFLGRLDAFANSLIREVNQQHSQGVGLTMFGNTLTGTQIKNVASLTSTLDPAPGAANVTIPAGSITINNRPVGEILGGAALNGLAMAKAYNAVTAINTAVTGVTAKLTTLTSSSAATIAATGTDNITMTLNGVGITVPVTALDSAATVNANFLAAVNAVKNQTGVKAVIGTGLNGAAVDTLILQNDGNGDSSTIDITAFSAGTTGTNINLALGTQSADATHNTGELTLFSTSTFTLNAGANDYILAQLGLTGPTVSGFDTQSNDGSITYGPLSASATVDTLLPGYDYFDKLDTSGSFDVWVYNTDGSLATPKPVTISMKGAYNLNDVVNIINTTMTNAGAATGATPWVKASISDNSLRLTPDASHKFAFANDTSNFLQVAGLNTFFTGSSAASIGINNTITGNLDNLAAATVGTQGQIFRGDNTNSLKMAGLQHDEYITFTGGTKNTLDGFYNTLVGQVANTTRTISQSYDSTVLINNQVTAMRDSVSGVSLDEEMANLIKYQHAYTAAARLITMSDEMLRTLLDSVR